MKTEGPKQPPQSASVAPIKSLPSSDGNAIAPIRPATSSLLDRKRVAPSMVGEMRDRPKVPRLSNSQVRASENPSKNVEGPVKLTIGLAPARTLRDRLERAPDVPTILQLIQDELKNDCPVDGVSLFHPTLNQQWSSVDLDQVGTQKSISIDLEGTGSPSVGVLSVYSDQPMEMVAAQGMQTVIQQALIPLQHMIDKATVEQLIYVDPLCGCGNRRAMEDFMDRQWSTSNRHDEPLSVVMVDIDHFKDVNDSYGHASGDAVLKSVAQTLMETVRKGDRVFRYGGEEFLIVMPKTNGDQVSFPAERVRQAVADASHLKEKPTPTTVSLGAAVKSNGHENWQAMVESADQALYQAKQNGRDQLVVSG